MQLPFSSKIKPGQNFKCTEYWHLVELEKAGVKGAYPITKDKKLPCFIHLYKNIAGEIGYDWSSEYTSTFRGYVEFSEFYKKWQKENEPPSPSSTKVFKSPEVKNEEKFTVMDALKELYIIKQENGDINELFDYFIQVDSDFGKLADYLYEQKMEREFEQEKDI